MRRHTQGSSPFYASTEFDLEQTDFKKNVRIVRLTEVTIGANIIGSNEIYKDKIQEDRTLKLKARTAPHFN